MKITDNEPNGTTNKEVDKMAQNILFMEKRGCDFCPGEHETSDIGNHRICTTGYIPLADGRKMFLEFTQRDHHRYRTVSKKGNRPLKHPVYELVMHDAAGLDTCFEREEHMFYRDSKLERSFYEPPRPYTLKTVLDFVNSIAAEHYDTIQFV